MSLSDLFDVGLQVGDWWQVNESIDEAEDYAKEGFGQGREDVKNYADPYFNAGLEHLDQYNDMGEFGFSYDNYLNSPNYEWLKDEGMKGVNRTAAAGHSLGSGNTLDALVRQNQNYAQSQYGDEFARQIQGYDTNKQYHQYPMGLGADAGRFAGQYLSDMAIGEAGALGSLEQARAESLSNLLGSAGAGEDGDSIVDTVVGAIEWAGDALGITGSDAIDWVSKTLGMSPDAVTGALGGSNGINAINFGSAADTFGGTYAAALGGAAGSTVGAAGGNGIAAIGGSAGTNGLGAVGLGSAGETFGGTYAAGLGGEAGTTATGASSVASSGFGTWAASVAGGFAVLAGLKFGVEAIRGEPPILGTLEEMSQQEDPFGWMFESSTKVPTKGLYSSATQEFAFGSGSEPIGLVDTFNSFSNPGDSTTVGKGTLSAMVINGMPDPTVLTSHNEIDSITESLLAAAGSGNTINGKSGVDPDAASAASALGKLFPEKSSEFSQLETISQEIVRMKAQVDSGDWTGINSGGDQRLQQQIQSLESQRTNLIGSLSAYTNSQVDKWSIDSLIAKNQAEAGVV